METPSGSSPSELGRGSSQDLPILAQPAQSLTLRRRVPVTPTSLIAIRLHNPVAKRLR